MSCRQMLNGTSGLTKIPLQSTRTYQILIKQTK